MPKEKFNPIAELPILPGAEVANDQLESDIIDSTYPKTEVPDEDALNPQIEIRLKPGVLPTEKNVLEEVDIEKDEKDSDRRLTIVRIIILVCLIAVVLLGMILILNFVPKLASNVSNFSKIFTSTPKSISTPAQVPATIPLVATSTPQVSTVVIIPIVTSQPTTTPVVVAPSTLTTATPIAMSQPKTPARLAANIISTNMVGNQTVVRFNIQNVGGTTSGPWSFSATLPSSVTPKYYSVEQDSLTPLSGVIYTLGFTADQYSAQYQYPYQNTPVQISIFQ